mmetsp:Transcript_30839/g.86434  ORF Transcript_30839/g.86434 Transcript_30839/m.86434 type:complete len:228 (-) Transcript_30839:161-844(-)
MPLVRMPDLSGLSLYACASLIWPSPVHGPFSWNFQWSRGWRSRPSSPGAPAAASPAASRRAAMYLECDRASLVTWMAVDVGDDVSMVVPSPFAPSSGVPRSWICWVSRASFRSLCCIAFLLRIIATAKFLTPPTSTFSSCFRSGGALMQQMHLSQPCSARCTDLRSVTSPLTASTASGSLARVPSSRSRTRARTWYPRSSSLLHTTLPTLPVAPATSTMRPSASGTS